jgi:hypothetical protein
MEGSNSLIFDWTVTESVLDTWLAVVLKSKINVHYSKLWFSHMWNDVLAVRTRQAYSSKFNEGFLKLYLRDIFFDLFQIPKFSIGLLTIPCVMEMYKPSAILVRTRNILTSTCFNLIWIPWRFIFWIFRIIFHIHLDVSVVSFKLTLIKV